VRDEEGRERHDDEVVEEQSPPGHERGRIVERAANEAGGPARLGHRGDALCIRERDEEEDEADGEEGPRGIAERVEDDDAERDVERRADLPVCDAGEGRGVDQALDPGQPARHQRLARKSRSEPARTRRPPRRSPSPPPTPAAIVRAMTARPRPTMTTERMVTRFMPSHAVVG
jgi:hypothetical protein